MTILRGMDAAWSNDEDSVRELCAQVRCPVLIIQGTEDAIVGAARGAAVAKLLPSADLVTMDGRATRRTCATRSGRTYHPRLRLPAAAPAALAPRPVAAPSARSTFPRRSALAMPSGTLPSPSSCVSSIPAWRSTGWPSIR